MQPIDAKDKISLKYLLDSAVDGEIYDSDIDRWIGIHLTEDIRQEIKLSIKEMICQKSR